MNSLSSQCDLTVTLITRTDAFELDDCTPVHAVTGRGAADTPGSSTQLTTAAVHTQAAETSTGGAKQLSVRDTTRASIGTATFWVDYGRPLARGRVLLGNILPYDRVWRTGANAATQFSTSAPITLASLRVPASTYTL